MGQLGHSASTIDPIAELEDRHAAKISEKACVISHRNQL
ncbi:hypothetical protein MAMO4S_04396 [Mesorhizobium amorphae]